MKNYANLSLDQYLEELSSAAPVPGGGSVSAYAASLAAGLMQMVARIAEARKQKSDLSEEQKLQDDANRLILRESVLELEKIKKEALEVVSLDPQVYDEVMGCYKRGAGADEIEDALNNSFRLQADLTLLVVMLSEWNAKLKTIVKGSVANDLIVSDGLIAAAFEGAYHTANINVVYMKDAVKKKEAEQALAKLKEKFSEGAHV